MSMLSVGNLDNKIIAASAQVSVKPAEKPKTQEQKKEKISSNTVLLLSGATALASIAIGCIAASRSKKLPKPSASENLKNVIPEHAKFPSLKPYTVEVPEVKEDKVQKVIGKIFSYDEKEENAIKTAEEKIKGEISALFKRFRDGAEEIPEFQYRPYEVVFTHPAPIVPDRRRLNRDDLKTVFSFVKNPQYNAKLSAGADVSGINEINVMRKLINEALPLEDEAYVYTGIRTQKVWDDFKPLEFVKDIETGAVIKDKSFVVTSRSYDEYLAQVDPYNLGKEHKDCGYILRIRLPKGTKGFDYRRCSGHDSSRGVNALYVLPENSEIKIRHTDDNSRILDCEYILPSA